MGTELKKVLEGDGKRKFSARYPKQFDDEKEIQKSDTDELDNLLRSKQGNREIWQELLTKRQWITEVKDFH